MSGDSVGVAPHKEEDALALDELTAIGYMTTPVVKIDEHVVIGFDQSRLEELLAQK